MLISRETQNVTLEILCQRAVPRTHSRSPGGRGSLCSSASGTVPRTFYVADTDLLRSEVRPVSEMGVKS